MANLQSLFNPRGIAIVGASPGSDRAGGQTVSALLEHGYAGGIYPVNPKYEQMSGLVCYASVADITTDCDVAVIALPAELVVDAIAACGDSGIRNAVVLGGGFRESGEEGVVREALLRRTAIDKNVRLIGPNCLGFVNIHANVYAAFGSISKPPVLQPGGVSAVIQSGGFGNSLVMRCGTAGIGFRYVVASGNETDISSAELIDAFVDDPETKLILAYLEGVRDGREFVAACERALAAGKPVVAWKAGNTKQGLKAAASHTANMTGTYDIYHAAFRQCGVVEVQTIEEAIDFIQAHFEQVRKPEGMNACIMGGSGGSSVVFADACDEYGLTLAPLSAATQASLWTLMPKAVSVDNPIDYAAGFLTSEDTPAFEQVVEHVLSDPAVDTLGVMFATVIGMSIMNGAKALAAVQARHDKPIYAFCSAPADLCAGAFELLKDAGIPNFPSPNRVAKVMALNAQWLRDRQALGNTTARGVDAQIDVKLPATKGALDEYQSKQILRAYGIAVTEDVLLPAEHIGVSNTPTVQYPVALKIVSRGIAHKSDMGGVMLNIRDARMLQQASTDMLHSMSKHAANAALEGLLVSEMITDGIETIVGIINDPCFGPVVAFGLGGTLAELMQDVTYRLAPFDIDTARNMITELRAATIFEGVRGAAPCDVDALAQLLTATSQFAWAQRERVAEVDINPVLVRPHGMGALAADALIVLK
ncbi:MAG: acyl-CoA synthetase (NDP forming) [Gammaproteobacteria bacterium]